MDSMYILALPFYIRMQIEEEALNTLNNHVQIFDWIINSSETMKIKNNHLSVTKNRSKSSYLDMVTYLTCILVVGISKRRQVV